MRKILFFMAGAMCATAIYVSGCTKPGDEQQIVELTVDETPVTVPAAGGTGKIDILTTVSWAVAVEPEDAETWLALVGVTGNGNGSVSYSVSKNAIATQRTAEIVIRANDLEKRVAFTQEAADAQFNVDKDRIDATADGGRFFVFVTANQDWEANLSDPSAQWITIQDNRGTGVGELIVDIEAKESIGERNAAISINPVGKADEAVEIAVVQKGIKASVSIDPKEIRDIPSEGLTRTITVTSNSSWSVESESWVTVTDGNGTGDGEFTITVANNDGNKDSREMKLTVNAEEGVQATLLLQQVAGYIPPEVKFNPSDDIKMTAEGGTVEVNISANVAWTVTSSADWITVSPSEGEGNQDGITLTVAANTNTEEREAVVTVSGEGAEHSINVIQEAAEEVEAGIKIGNLIWATRNVGETGKFASGGIGDVGMFYQFNRTRAYPSTGTIPSGTWETETPSAGGWNEENSPCPNGWRIPTEAEFRTLASLASGNKRRTANVGFWFRESPSFEYPFPSVEDPQDALLLPYGGLRQNSNGNISKAKGDGYYWTCEVDSSDNPIIVHFASTFTSSSIAPMGILDGNKNSGLLIRCVKDAEE